MSVDKVKKYKADKEARAKAQKKEKLQSTIATTVVILIVIAIIAWIGYAIYENTVGKKEGTNATTVNVEAIDNYLESLEYTEADPGELE